MGNKATLNENSGFKGNDSILGLKNRSSIDQQMQRTSELHASSVVDIPRNIRHSQVAISPIRNAPIPQNSQEQERPVAPLAQKQKDPSKKEQMSKAELMNILVYFRNGDVGRQELEEQTKDVDLQNLTLATIADILSKSLTETEEYKETAEKAIAFFDTFKAGQVSSNLLAETILENKAIDDGYFAYLEPQNHELKVNELIWHLSERYLNEDSDQDEGTPKKSEADTLERKRESIKSEQEQPSKEQENEQGQSEKEDSDIEEVTDRSYKRRKEAAKATGFLFPKISIIYRRAVELIFGKLQYK